MKRMYRLILLLLAVTCPLALPATAAPVHGIAMHGDPALPSGFAHFPYANPNAPKGGILRQAVTGSFDSLNPFIIKGQAAAGVRMYVFESLMARNRAEPFGLYGLLAKSIEVPDDRSSVTFHLRPEARFSDGRPVTVEDVLFSHQVLRDHGRPNHRTYYRKVERTQTPDPHTITFHLEGNDRELVLILGLMPILPKHRFTDGSFEKTTLQPLVGSGPYTIAEIKPGESITYRRDENYWGKDLAVSRGLWNFDEVRFDYFRDSQATFEALKKHLTDIRYENDPVRWSTGYDFEAVKQGKLRKEVIKLGLPRPTGGMVFNTRRSIFQDPRVREALLYVFDFEWANANLFHGLFARTQGFYDGSILSSIGREASPAERDILKRLGADLRADILDGSYRIPVSDASGKDRKNLRQAIKLLKSAGWSIKGGTLVSDKSGEPFTFELTTRTREQENIGLHFKRSLRLIGVTLNIRTVDSAQFQRRLQAYDYDMMTYTWYNSLSPGNEQTFYWGSAGRTQEGTRNYMGVADPAIDGAITEILKATGSDEFTTAVRVLDRLLTAGHYIVPLYNSAGQWLARWNNIARPDSVSLYGFLSETAWHAGTAN